jgi:hypothetical protein
MKTKAWLGGLAVVFSGTLVFAACATSSESGDSPTGGGAAYGGGASAGAGGAGGAGNDASSSGGWSGTGASSGGTAGDSATLFDYKPSDGPQFDPDAFWANDPPPKQCMDGGMNPPPPGGTPECPDDKNRQGCPCFELGKQAACWPGLRKNRNRGICHDGTTTCIQKGENQKVWGPCEGYQLPTGTTGKDGCLCFSGGQWKLENLSPCFGAMQGDPPGSLGAVSTIFDGKQGQCPQMNQNGFIKPTQPWSKNTLKVDCAGHFKLCYTLKAGDAKNPQPSDCTLIEVCTEADYPKPDVDQPFPDLPAWLADSTAQKSCAVKFAGTSGYGEMSVIGLSVECDVVDNGSGGRKVFNRVQYCPLSCNTNPNAPECKNCMSGGSGSF